MDSSQISQVVAILILVACSGYFSATETAFTSLNRIRLKSKAEAGDRRAGVLLRLAEDYDSVLSTLLIGNNIVNNAATTVSGWVTEELQRLPQAGDSFRAEGLEVTVTRVDHRRVLEMRAMECKEAGVEV